MNYRSVCLPFGPKRFGFPNREKYYRNICEEWAFTGEPSPSPVPSAMMNPCD